MPIVPFGEFRPDVADYEGQHSKDITNVVPHGDGYGPFLSFSAFSAAMADTCRGIFYALKNDGSVSVFAGTSNKLYNLNNTNQTWTDVSKGATTYSALSSSAQWQFRQFNNFVFAVQQNAPVQVFDLTSSTAFADLGGSPPQAAYIAIVNEFVVLSGIFSGSPPTVYRVQWSGLDATTTWTAGVSQSDFQDLADGGIVRGVAGGEFGIIFQDRMIRRMTYAPGSPVVFTIEKIAEDQGLYAPYSVIQAGQRIFYLSTLGFMQLQPGLYPQPIGKERVDRTFFNDVDAANLQLVVGASDPKASRVYWAYKSINGSTGLFDKILVYDWALDRWATVKVSGEYLVLMSQPGITLEGVDTAYGNNIDTLTIPSLDSISNAAVPQLAAVNSTHKLGFFSGSALEATLESAEHGGDGRRIFVRGFRPVTDAPGCFGSVSTREREENTATYTAEQQINAVGMIPARTSTRYARGKLRIPAGTSWTFAAGVEPDVSLEGQR